MGRTQKKIMLSLALAPAELADAKGDRTNVGAILAPATLPMLARHAVTRMTSMNDSTLQEDGKKAGGGEPPEGRGVATTLTPDLRAVPWLSGNDQPEKAIPCHSRRHKPQSKSAARNLHDQ